MPKSRITGNQKQQTFTLDPAYSHTIDIANMSLIEDDVDDNNICPVCDGECTCGPPPSSSTALSPPRLTPVAVAAPSPILNPNGDGLAPMSAAAPRPHPLKIRLTLPPNMLAKNTAGSPPTSKPAHKLPKFKKFKHLVSDQDAAASQPHYQDPSSSTLSIAVAGPSSHHQSTPFAVAVSKKKGSISHHGHSNSTGSHHHHHRTGSHSKPSKSSLSSNRRDISPSASYYPQYGMAMQARKDALTRKARALKAKNTAVKKFAAAKKKKTKKARKPMPWDVDDSEDDSHNIFQGGLYSDEDDDLIPYGGNNHDGDDGHLDHLPTFLPASALSSESEASSSSLSELTSEESDASVAAEEETFIVQQEERRSHDKARVRRELLGDDTPRHILQNNNNWIIRPRQKSAGLSDVDMDTDSEATEEDELQNDDQDMLGGDDDDEDEDEDGAADGDGDGESDREELCARYVGLATGWSDDEESSFDADLFFANLSDSSARDDSSSSDCAVDVDDDGYLTDIGSIAAANEPRPEGLEIAQGWDGQIVFTTAGAPHGHGVLDLDFEARAAALAEADADADVEASDDVVMTDYYEGDEDDADDLDDDVAFDDNGCSDGGDTTDDELVDEHNRPTARALALFRWPASVSTINPLVIASPSASPAPRVNRSTVSGSADDDSLDSPVAGKRGNFFSFSLDDFAEPDESSFAKQNRGPPSVGGFPSRGSFTATSETSAERIIIDRKTPGPLPLPYRLVQGRTRPRAYSSSTNSDFDIRGRSLSLSRSHHHHHPLSLSISSITEEHIAPSDDAASLPATSIDLDDVLHSSVLEAGPHESMTSSYLSNEPEARNAPNSHDHIIVTATANNDVNNDNNTCPDLNRWDHIPVDTFRRAREAGGDAAAAAAASTTTEGVTESFSAMSVMKSPYSKQEGPFALRPPFGTALYHNRAAARMRRARARQAPGTPTPTGRMMTPGRMNNKTVLSPMLLPLRGSGGDGDVTPTTLGGGAQLEAMSSGGSSNKTRKELRREKKMKRKALAPAGAAHRNPYPHQHHHQQHHHFNHHHHQHYPNMKSRSTGAVQRMGSMGAPPPLNL